MCPSYPFRGKGKNTFEEGRNKPAKGKNKEKTSKGKGKKNASVKQESEKVICKHCSKPGHEEKNYWKLHPEKIPQFNKSKGKQKTVATTSTPQDLGDDSGDETKITAMGLKNLKGKEMEIQASTSTSNCHVQAPNEEERIELFHVRVISKHTKIDTLFDSGSQANLISEDLVK